MFRRGRSMVSRLVLWADSEGEYSHVGVIVRHEGEVLVVHAEPGERFEDGYVRAEPVDSFLAPVRATAWALYRPVEELDSAETALLGEAALRHVRERTPFDAALDTRDSGRLYCTELVIELYRATSRDLAIPVRRFEFLGQFREVVLPADIAQNRLFRYVMGFPGQDSVPGTEVAF